MSKDELTKEKIQRRNSIERLLKREISKEMREAIKKHGFLGLFVDPNKALGVALDKEAQSVLLDK